MISWSTGEGKGLSRLKSLKEDTFFLKCLVKVVVKQVGTGRSVVPRRIELMKTLL